MSSPTHNTRSRTNPSQAPPTVSGKIRIPPLKVSGTGTASVEETTGSKEAIEREAAIAQLVDIETRITADRAANLKTFARPSLDHGQVDSAGRDSDDYGHAHNQAHGGVSEHGRGGEGNRVRSSGSNRGGRGRSRGRSPRQAITEDHRQSTRTPIPSESNISHASFPRNSPVENVGNTIDDGANHPSPPTNTSPTDPGIRTGPNDLDDTHNPSEDAGSEEVSVGVTEKASRKRGIRDEVAERVRLRTNSQAVDSSDDEEVNEDPVPAPTSKRKKPPPPPTMYVYLSVKFQ